MELLTPPDIFADKTDYIHQVIIDLEAQGFKVAEVNTDKPWGAYIRLESGNAEAFIEKFFPRLSLEEARLGSEAAELSPKILVVSPGQRLSLQYHHNRAERWRFLTAGAYDKSMNDDPGDPLTAQAGDEVQFATAERHRLRGLPEGFVVVAEIWQHTNPAKASNEDDIVRLEDDYSR